MARLNWIYDVSASCFASQNAGNTGGCHRAWFTLSFIEDTWSVLPGVVVHALSVAMFKASLNYKVRLPLSVSCLSLKKDSFIMYNGIIYFRSLCVICFFFDALVIRPQFCQEQAKTGWTALCFTKLYWTTESKARKYNVSISLFDYYLLYLT